MKYVITGGSGYIGGRLIDLILGRGDAEIVNVDIKPPPGERAGAQTGGVHENALTCIDNHRRSDTRGLRDSSTATNASGCCCGRRTGMRSVASDRR